MSKEIRLIEQVIQTSYCTELDLTPPFYDDDKEEGGQVEIPWREMPYAQVPSMPISTLEGLIADAKAKGADRVTIADHVDHHGYYFYFTTIHRVEREPPVQQDYTIEVNADLTTKITAATLLALFDVVIGSELLEQKILYTGFNGCEIDTLYLRYKLESKNLSLGLKANLCRIADKSGAPYISVRTKWGKEDPVGILIYRSDWGGIVRAFDPATFYTPSKH